MHLDVSFRVFQPGWPLSSICLVVKCLVLLTCYLTHSFAASVLSDHSASAIRFWLHVFYSFAATPSVSHGFSAIFYLLHYSSSIRLLHGFVVVNS